MKRYFDILSKQPRPLRFVVSRLLRDTHTCELLTIQKNGYRLKLHPASLSLSLWVNSQDRSHDEWVVSRLLKPGDIYVDIGANIGQLVVVGGLAVGEKGKVYAFEAHPRTVRFLQENVALNHLENVLIAQLACGDHFGFVSFSNERSDDQNKVSISGTGISVPIVRLDHFIKHEKIKLLKIDVEGYEKYVINGASDILDEVKFIYFEAYDAHYKAAGYRFSDLHTILNGQGFSVYSLIKNKISAISANDSFPECINIFAMRDSCKDEFSQCMGIS